MVEPQKGSARSVVPKRSGWPLCGFCSVLEWTAPHSGASYLTTPFRYGVWTSLFELGLGSYRYSFRQQGFTEVSLPRSGFMAGCRVDQSLFSRGHL